MISVSPHLYRQIGAQKKIPSEIVNRALDQAATPESKGIPAVLTLGHLAHLTGANSTYLRSIARREVDPYRTFIISKRTGGGRLIAVPDAILASTQRWIAQRILKQRPPHPASQAYHPRSSPIVCAQKHLCARWLIKVDIHDFFESIDERRVYGVFRACGYQPLVSFQMARICTRVSHGQSAQEKRWRVTRQRAKSGIPGYSAEILGHLPQGAPTSPMLSNLASENLDACIHALSTKFGLVYTRYADDITLSTGGEFTRDRASTVLIEIERIFSSFNHEINRKKVIIVPPGARKVVLGLLVDGEQVRLPRFFRQNIRDHVRGIQKFGLASHAKERHFSSVWGMIHHLSGLLAYARHVDSDFATTLQKQLATTLREQNLQP